MYSSEDLERFYFQYQTEAMPNGVSIEHYLRDFTDMRCKHSWVLQY